MSAQRLASGAGYDNLLYPPGQAVWLSIWIRWLGAELRVVSLAQIIAGVFTVVVLFYGLRAYSHRAARWGAVAAAFYPSLILWDGTLGHEVLDLAMLALLLLVYMTALQSGRAAWWIVMGVAGGLTVLAWPVMLVLPAAVGVMLWLGRQSVRQIVTAGALVLLSMAVVIGPWSARNYRIWHKFCLVSANFGSILYRCNNPQSDGIYMASAPGISAGDDLIDFDAKCLRAGMRFIAKNPGRFLELTAKRIIFLWGSDASMLDALLAGYEGSRDVVKPGVACILQFVWSWLMGCWLISAWWGHTDIDQRWPGSLWCVFVIFLIGGVHAIVEPFTRRHFPAIPFLVALVLPAYMELLEKQRARRVPT